jgi:hypothetical protein
MNSFSHSILARSLMTGVATLALVVVAPAAVRAETVIVLGDDGAAGADGVNSGDPGMPGDDGESVAANAGSVHPITAVTEATAERRLRGQPRPSSLARRKRTLFLMAVLVVGAAEAEIFRVSTAMVAPAVPLLLRVLRRTRTAARSPAVRARSAVREGSQASSSAAAMAVRAAARRLVATRPPAVRRT